MLYLLVPYCIYSYNILSIKYDKVLFRKTSLLERFTSECDI